MSKSEQTEPVMDGATEATDAEKRAGIVEVAKSRNSTDAAAQQEIDERLEESGMSSADAVDSSPEH